MTITIEIPDEFWQHAEVLDALRRRDIGRLFVLLNDATGISQTRLAIACDTTQPKISGYMRGVSKVEELDVFERIADGLNMPDSARIALGLAPQADPTSPASPSGPGGSSHARATFKTFAPSATSTQYSLTSGTLAKDPSTQRRLSAVASTASSPLTRPKPLA